MTFIESIRVRERLKKIETARKLYAKYLSLKLVAKKMGYSSINGVWQLLRDGERRATKRTKS